MVSPEQLVFDSHDLRKLILKHVLKDEYLKQLSIWIRGTMNEQIQHKWHLYCSCNGCKRLAYEQLNEF